MVRHIFIKKHVFLNATERTEYQKPFYNYVISGTILLKYVCLWQKIKFRVFQICGTKTPLDLLHLYPSL